MISGRAVVQIGELYNAEQIIGKTLYARTAYPLKRDPSDAAPVTYTGKPGDMVGKVVEWYNVIPGKRSVLHWAFKDANGRLYYAPHAEGRFSTSELKEQGAFTVKEKLQADQRANETNKEYIERLLKYGIIALVIGGVAKAVIPGLLTGKRAAA